MRINFNVFIVLIIGSLMLPSITGAGPLLDAALRSAAETRPDSFTSSTGTQQSLPVGSLMLPSNTEAGPLLEATLRSASETRPGSSAISNGTQESLAIGSLMLPSSTEAGPLLTAALRSAAETRPGPFAISTGTQQALGCAGANAAGQELADRREGMGGYMAGGIFIPVIMPLIGMASSPTVPASELRNVDDADLACFQEGYRERGRSRKVRAGWIGTGIGVGLYVVLLTVAASSSPY